MSPYRRTLTIFDLTRSGRRYGYEQVWRWQKALQENVYRNRRALESTDSGAGAAVPWLRSDVHDALILCEHPSTYTLGRGSSLSHILKPLSPLGQSTLGGECRQGGSGKVLDLCKDAAQLLQYETESGGSNVSAAELEQRRQQHDALGALSSLGMVRRVERGGEVTWHGPGQLLAYPVLDLKRPPTERLVVAEAGASAGGVVFEDLRWYVRSLEQCVLGLLGDGLGQLQLASGLSRVGRITGLRRPAYPGVWVQNSSSNSRVDRGSTELPHLDDRYAPVTPSYSKVCAVGISASRWITMHGLSINVSLSREDVARYYHEHIVPCGIVDPLHRGVSSIRIEHEQQQQLHGALPTDPPLVPPLGVGVVADLFVDQFVRQFGYWDSSGGRSGRGSAVTVIHDGAVGDDAQATSTLDAVWRGVYGVAPRGEGAG